MSIWTLEEKTDNPQQPEKKSKQKPGRRVLNKAGRQCYVCGDKALSCNFDAITCESCKAFFRRNASRSIPSLKCSNMGECDVSVATRRFCKHCRLKKCFEIGMKKEYILSVEERAEKRNKIGQNKIIKRLEQHGWIDRNFSIHDINDRDLLEDKEIDLIEEILAAYNKSLATKLEVEISLDSEPTFQWLINIAEISLRRTICMFCNLSAFREIKRTDQNILLKIACIDLLIMRGIICFDPEEKRFLEQGDSNFRQGAGVTFQEFLQGAGEHVSRAFELLTNSLICRLNSCQTTLLLLFVILMFASHFGQCFRSLADISEESKPACSFSPETHQLIEKNLYQYTLLLKHFLSTKYPRHKAEIIFPQVIAAIGDINIINQLLHRNLLTMKVTQSRPFILDFIDSNNSDLMSDM